MDAALFLISFAWFASHAVPGVYYGDCGEMLCDVVRGFVPHPTGFPTYLLFESPFASWGSLAVNFSNALWAALSVSLVHALTRRLLSREGWRPGEVRWGALAAAVSWAGSCTLMLHAAGARVYPLQVALLLAGMLWTVEFTPTRRWALGWGLLFGLASGTHALFLVLVPWTWVLVGRRLGSSKTLWPFLAMGCLWGASVHLWIPLRAAMNPVVNWGEPASFGAWWAYVTQAGYRYKMWARDFGGTILFAKEALRSWTLEWNPLVWALGLLGCAALFRRDRTLAWAGALSCAANLGLLWMYGGEFDLTVLYRYFLPFYALAAVAAGWGAASALRWLAARDWNRTGYVGAAFLLFAVATLAFPAVRWRDLARNTTARDFGLGILRSVPRGGTLEVATDNQLGPLAYLRYVEGKRGDLHLVEWYGTLFPDTVRRMRQNPSLTRESVEAEFLREGGGALYLPNNRPVQAPMRCEPWGMTFRLGDSAPPETLRPPRLSEMPSRRFSSDEGDDESQDVVGYRLLHEVDEANRLGDRPGALGKLAEIEDRCARCANVLVDAAVAYQRLGLEGKTETLLGKALRLRPHHYTGNLNRGLVSARRGNYAEAVRCFRTAHESIPGETMALGFLRQVQGLSGSAP